MTIMVGLYAHGTGADTLYGEHVMVSERPGIMVPLCGMAAGARYVAPIDRHSRGFGLVCRVCMHGMVRALENRPPRANRRRKAVPQ